MEEAQGRIEAMAAPVHQPMVEPELVSRDDAVRSVGAGQAEGPIPHSPAHLRHAAGADDPPQAQVHSSRAQPEGLPEVVRGARPERLEVEVGRDAERARPFDAAPEVRLGLLPLVVDAQVDRFAGEVEVAQDDLLA